LSSPNLSHRIVHFYVDKAFYWAHCQRTFALIESLREDYNIESVRLDGSDDYAYWKALKELWGLADLLLIQQDIVFTEEQLNEILECEHPDCAFAYRLYPITTALPDEVWSVGENRLPERIRLFTIEEKPEFCSFASLGFIKLSKDTQRKVELDAPVTWRFIDLETIGKVKDAKIHVHYEVEHTNK